VEFKDCTLIEHHCPLCTYPCSIPSTIGALTNLTYLRLSNNALTGTVPTSLFSLRGLVFCYLEKNLLSGSIVSWPKSWKQLHCALGEAH
jgi:hypothetical protein